MKKLISYAGVLFCGIVLFAACEKQEVSQMKEAQIESAETQAMNELMLDLENYNKSYFCTKGQTRSFWGWLRKLTRVVYADATGGLVGAICGPWGAVSGAAISSAIIYMADDGQAVHPPLKPMNFPGGELNDLGGDLGDPDGNIMNSDALTYSVISSNNGYWADSVGYYHNSILMNLNENEMLNNGNSYYLNLMINSICQQADGMSLNGRGNTTNQQLLSAINYTQLKAVLEDDSYSYSFDDFVDALIAIYPQYESELDFLKSYIESLCEINQSQNNGSYAQGVLNLVNNSNVSNIVKQRLGDAVIAGNASARLWNFE